MAANESCPICLEDFICPISTNCGHKFCARCMLSHLQHDCRCPMCRREVTLLMGGEEWISVENRNTYNQVAEYNHRVSTTNSAGMFSMLGDAPAVFRHILFGIPPVAITLSILLVLVLRRPLP